MATKAKELHQKIKHNFVLERLMELGVTESQTGKSIHQLDYEDAKYELVIAEMRQIDIENDSNMWW